MPDRWVKESFMRNVVVALLTAMGAFGVGVPFTAPVPALRMIAEFDLPGPGGKRFDYLTVDADDRYLLSAHLGAGQTYVIGLRTNRVGGTITDTPGAERIEYGPELKKFYTSNARDNTIGGVGLEQLKTVKKS